MAEDADDAGHPATTHARTDRQSAGRSVETTPESLYLLRIALLEARVGTLQHRVEQKEHDLQYVIDHYEHVLDERATDPRSELLTDGGERPDATSVTTAERSANDQRFDSDQRPADSRQTGSRQNDSRPDSRTRRVLDRARSLFE